MKIIEFENTQGIILRYTPAGVFERILSYLLDAIILGIVLWIISMIFANGRNAELVIYAVILPIFLFYSLFMETVNNGQSLGKMILGLKVVRVDGKYPTGYDFLMRWFFRWIDIYLNFGILAIITISATPKSQRFGDMLADTTVIKSRNLRVSLERILEISNLQNYKPVYPQVTQFTEEQVLMAKNVLERSLKYKNKAHQDALHDLVMRLSESMEIKRPADSHAFIQTLIKDYVALTR